LYRLSRTLVAVCTAALLCAHARPSRVPSAAARAAEGQSRLPTLKPANILDALKRRKADRPALSASALARYANELLARRGFDYDFNACEVFMPHAPANASAETDVIFDQRLTRLDGREATFRIVTSNFGAPCGECYLSFPALRVTKGEMTVVADGAVYDLKRPPEFVLDEAYLVAEDLKTVLRTWQLPHQTIPSGVSPDGRGLYVSFYDDYGLDELVLEIREDGRARFRVANEVGAGGGEWIDEHPKDPSNVYLGFMRFRSGGRTRVVSFSAPCT
jgi:hypothetical protein